ncbi:hypothetical protein ACFQWG_02965 [Schaalia naturae]|jgi:hypothetical protein|uniref:SAF domain-containing protein n=2 Tax=Schaalia naturae TaxID=635203 RepID=A0ABW2SKU2_9ACTO
MTSMKRAVRVPGRRGAWRDPRFVVGIVLIAVSVLGCVTLVSQARGGTPLYQTTRAVPAGEPLDATNTRIVRARAESDAYLVEGSLGAGDVAARSLGAGELVPAVAVAAGDDVDHRRLVVTVSGGLPDSAGPGAALELWFVPGAPGAAPAREADPAPRLVSDAVTLVRADAPSAGLGATAGTRLEVRVPVDDLAAVLQATGGDGTLAAVPLSR